MKILSVVFIMLMSFSSVTFAAASHYWDPRWENNTLLEQLAE